MSLHLLLVRSCKASAKGGTAQPQGNSTSLYSTNLSGFLDGLYNLLVVYHSVQFRHVTDTNFISLGFKCQFFVKTVLNGNTVT